MELRELVMMIDKMWEETISRKWDYVDLNRETDYLEGELNAYRKIITILEDKMRNEEAEIKWPRKDFHYED